MINVLVTDSRNWKNRFSIIVEFGLLMKRFDTDDITIIHGDCKGADRIADLVASRMWLKTKPYSAKWAKYGRSAGPKRNQQMVDENEIDYALVFHENLNESKGTRDMVKRLQKKNIPYKVITK